MPFPVCGFYEALCLVFSIIKTWNDLIEITGNLHGRLFNVVAFHDIYNIVSSDMPYKAAEGLSLFNSIEDKPAQHLQDFIAPAESIPVIIRLEIIEVRVCQGKLLA